MAKIVKPEPGVVTLWGAKFHYSVRPLETTIKFPDGVSRTFPNCDVMNVRERYYMEEFVNMPLSDYVKQTAKPGDVVQFGIEPAHVTKFLNLKWREDYEETAAEAASA